MSSCCNGPQNRKVKEWGKVDKKNTFSNNTKLLISFGIIFVLVLGLIIFR